MIIDERERDRRRRLATSHVAAENTHDLDAIMATFSPHAIVQVNERVATTPEDIAAEYVQLGLSAQPGWLSDLAVVHEHEHFTDQDIAYEGFFVGKHIGAPAGYPPPSGQEVKLRFVVVYRFDQDDLLVSASARVDFTPFLFPPLATPVQTP